MKTIGLIGGLTWVSTAEYYNIINSEVSKRAGGHNAAHIIMHSVNFGEFKQLADKDKWNEIGNRLHDVALKLESAGAQMLLICSNTPHKVADIITESLKIPFIHIGEVTADAVHSVGINKAALLGTKYTMEGTFYSEKLARRGIGTIIPDNDDMVFIHNSIFNELGKNIFRADTKSAYIKIINKLIERGAQGIILGCTEIPLLIKQEDSPVKVFDTTFIHANAAVELALDQL